MERLVDNIYSFKGKVEECENAYLLAAQKKFKDYEDLEEQGRLLKLPCDKVYYIVDKNNPKYAAVMSKSIRDLAVYEIENIDIDGRYFSTDELVEAKLKELRGE